MLTPFELTLLFIIAGLLLLCAWQSFHHERTMERLSRDWAVPAPLRWTVPPERPAPIPLLVPARAGWGTLLDDIAPTKEFRPSRLPSFTIQEFGGVCGIPLAQERREW